MIQDLQTKNELIELLPYLTAQERAELDRFIEVPNVNYSLEEIEFQSWLDWLVYYFRSSIASGFAPHHIEFWDWIWQLNKGIRPQPFVAIWARGGAKSSSAELAAAMSAMRLTRHYIVYVCHEKGTMVKTPELNFWHTVESHPTATEKIADGVSVKIFGLPYPETVTTDHRYWARTIKRKDNGHGRPPSYCISEPDWIRADRLSKDTWIAYPVDYSVCECPTLEKWDSHTRTFSNISIQDFNDKEFWWFVGLWWGDGTLGGKEFAQISIAVADEDLHIKKRLTEWLDVRGNHWHEVKRDGCSHISFCDSVIARWLLTWKHGNSRKTPPDWVEQLSNEFISEIVKGYVDADGHTDHRSVRVASIHLEGLLSLRRMLMRLGIAGTITKVKDAGQDKFPSGNTYKTQIAYRLQFTRGAEKLGYYLPCFNDKYNHPVTYVENGFLWSRVREITPVTNRVFVPIQTKTQTYLTAFGLSHNCETQDQADKHVATIATLLESASVERALNKYGSSKGWRRNRLRTREGATIDALGLDTASRGIKVDADRPDMMVLDDVDGRHDSLAATQKKIETLTTTILPAGSNDCAVVFVQNLIHVNSIASQLADGRADFLLDRIVSGPFKAVNNLQYQAQGGRYIITAGTPTWDGQSLETCEGQINSWGLEAFLREAQHEVATVEGSVFGDVWDDTENGNVTTKAEYEPGNGEVLWAIDDGYAGEWIPETGYYSAESHPRVILMCQQRPNGVLCVFNESYAVKVESQQHIKQVLDSAPRPERVGLGKEMAEIRGTLHKLGIYTLSGPSSVDESVKVLRSWIAPDVNGIRKVLVHPRCKILRKEPPLFSHIEGSAWEDKFGHGLAALRYLCWALRFN